MGGGGDLDDGERLLKSPPPHRNVSDNLANGPHLIYESISLHTILRI